MNARTLSCLAGLMTGAQALAQPSITTEPIDQSVSLNATVQFKVAALTSGGPVTFRWWFKDATLDPALNPSAARNTLILSNATEVMAGAYWVVVSDDNGSATSQTAQLTVDARFTKLTEGPVVTDRASSWGCAWVDYDNDGHLDLFVANGAEAGADQANALYRNLGDGTFSRMSAGEIGSLATDAHRWTGCTWGDFDNDGHVAGAALPEQRRRHVHPRDRGRLARGERNAAEPLLGGLRQRRSARLVRDVLQPDEPSLSQRWGRSILSRADR